MCQERIHGGGKQGRASVNGSPDSCGIHSLIGVIDTSLLLRYFFVCPKRAYIFPIPEYFINRQNGEYLSIRTRTLSRKGLASPQKDVMVAPRLGNFITEHAWKQEETLFFPCELANWHGHNEGIRCGGGTGLLGVWH